MAISLRGVSNAAGQNAGSSVASTVSITPTLPASSAVGDRVFVVQCGTTTSGTTPTNWNVVGTKDTTVGSGVVASGSGARRMTIYWRDYDGQWVMPAFTLTSAAANSHWIGAVAITPTSGKAFDTPTISTVGGSFNTATTSYTDTTAASFTTHSGGFLIVGTALNDNVTSTSPGLSQTGATLASVTERCDGGNATASTNIVAGQVHTASVTTGASATATFTQTLSAASQGETLIVEQTESTHPYCATIGGILTGSSSTTAAVPVPPGVVGTTTDPGEVIVVVMYVENSQAVTPDTGFVHAGSSPVTNSSATKPIVLSVFWKRATGADSGTYAFTVAAGLAWREGYALRYTGCVTSGNPFDVTTSAQADSGAAGAFTSVSATTTVANDLLVYIATTYDGRTVALPSGFAGKAGSGAWIISDNPQPSAGATGSIAGSWSGSNTSTVVWLGALKPPGGATVDYTKFYVLLA